MYEQSLLAHATFKYGARLAMMCIMLLFMLCAPVSVSASIRVETAVLLFLLSNLGTIAARSVIDRHHVGLGSNYGRRCASCGLPLVLEKAPRTAPGGLRAPAPWPNVSMLACVRSQFAYGHTRQLVRVKS